MKLNLNHATTTISPTAIIVLPQFVPAKRSRHSQRKTARGGKGMPPLPNIELSRSGKSNASP